MLRDGLWLRDFHFVAQVQGEDCEFAERFLFRVCLFGFGADELRGPGFTAHNRE
jgi:hypothetical protein